MIKEYQVYRDKRVAGRVILEQQGLYYRIHCRCESVEQERESLIASWDSGQQELGLCIPEGEVLLLERLLPCKALPENKLKFFLIKKELRQFVPVQEGETFAYLDCLEEAVFAIEENVPGLQIHSRPTGQWSEPRISE